MAGRVEFRVMYDGEWNDDDKALWHSPRQVRWRLEGELNGPADGDVGWSSSGDGGSGESDGDESDGASS